MKIIFRCLLLMTVSIILLSNISCAAKPLNNEDNEIADPELKVMVSDLHDLINALAERGQNINQLRNHVIDSGSNVDDKQFNKEIVNDCFREIIELVMDKHQVLAKEKENLGRALTTHTWEEK